jgi:hypothetical protein
VFPCVGFESVQQFVKKILLVYLVHGGVYHYRRGGSGTKTAMRMMIDLGCAVGLIGGSAQCKGNGKWDVRSNT